MELQMYLDSKSHITVKFPGCDPKFRESFAKAPRKIHESSDWPGWPPIQKFGQGKPRKWIRTSFVVFHISTSKSGPLLWCFVHFDLKECFSPLFISQLASWLRTRRFSEPTFRPSGATNHWKNTVFGDFPTKQRPPATRCNINPHVATVITAAKRCPLCLESKVSICTSLRKTEIVVTCFPRKLAKVNFRPMDAAKEKPCIAKGSRKRSRKGRQNRTKGNGVSATAHMRFWVFGVHTYILGPKCVSILGLSTIMYDLW